jgi:hypothetical protein
MDQQDDRKLRHGSLEVSLVKTSCFHNFLHAHEYFCMIVPSPCFPIESRILASPRMRFYTRAYYEMCYYFLLYYILEVISDSFSSWNGVMMSLNFAL